MTVGLCCAVGSCCAVLCCARLAACAMCYTAPQHHSKASHPRVPQLQTNERSAFQWGLALLSTLKQDDKHKRHRKVCVDCVVARKEGVRYVAAL